MKSYIKIFILTLSLSLNMPGTIATAAPMQLAILEIIKAAVKKVIKAVDLRIQRLQNKTIWLQNAQKVLENKLSQLKLREIKNWSEKQKAQYSQYFDELKKIKSTIRYYQRIKEVTVKQARMVEEHNRAWKRLTQDKNFNAEELREMERVYQGILGEGMKNLEQIQLVLNPGSLQMGDAGRIQLINETADRVDQNFDHLMAFNQQNMLLSLHRSKSRNEIELTKKLYGLQ